MHFDLYEESVRDSLPPPSRKNWSNDCFTSCIQPPSVRSPIATVVGSSCRRCRCAPFLLPSPPPSAWHLARRLVHFGLGAPLARSLGVVCANKLVQAKSSLSRSPSNISPHTLLMWPNCTAIHTHNIWRIENYRDKKIRAEMIFRGFKKPRQLHRQLLVLNSGRPFLKGNEGLNQ